MRCFRIYSASNKKIFEKKNDIIAIHFVRGAEARVDTKDISLYVLSYCTPIVQQQTIFNKACFCEVLTEFHFIEK